MDNTMINDYFLEDSWKSSSNYTSGTSYFVDNRAYKDKVRIKTAPELEEIFRTQCPPEFVKLMDNRMWQGFFRYGPKEKQKDHYDYVDLAFQRMGRYLETLNLECLVDAANLLRMEFYNPGDKRAYFNSENDEFHCTPKNL